jgi:hypothetical protein
MFHLSTARQVATLLIISRLARFFLFRFTYKQERRSIAVELIKPVSVAKMEQGSKIK